MKYFSFLCVFISLLYGVFVVASDKNQQELRASLILKNLKCMACAGQSVLESESQFAKSLKEYVTQEIVKGKKDEDIYDEIRQRYGDEIFFKPPVNNYTILLWLLPFFLIFIGFVAVIIFLKKRPLAV
jgi:cytochrome c-type biogenesis protein CcmH